MQPGSRHLWDEGQRCVLAGRYEDARAAFCALLQRHPGQASVRLLLAGTILAEGRVRGAAEQLRLAARSPPGDVTALCRIVQGLSSLGESVAARACLQAVPAGRVRGGRALLAIAHLYQGLGLHREALAWMERARDAGLDDADFLYFHALQLQFNGRLAEAEAGMEACLRKGAASGRAALSLARIRRQTASRHHLDAIRARLATVPRGSEDHAAFEFALHKELDDLGELDDAWQALERGNAVMRGRLAYDGDAEARLVEGLVARFDRAFPALPAHAPDGPMPIFIVGLPRSGTTLLERMLGNHGDIAPAGELNDLPRQLRWAADRHGHALLDEALLEATDAIDYAALGRRYLQQTRWRADGRRWYVDKLPPNWMLLGHLRRALPHARVLHLVRDPMDLCFSNYRALFGDSYAYSYGFESLARHHGHYRRLMEHWHAAMPGFVLDVAYADLVRDPEAACRKVLASCGLPFQAACLDTAGNAASVATLSSAQVRQPIHARGLGEWRRYERQLRPLRERLDARA